MVPISGLRRKSIQQALVDAGRIETILSDGLLENVLNVRFQHSRHTTRRLDVTNKAAQL